MTKKMPLALALVAGLAMAAPPTASACSACGQRTHYTSRVTYARPAPVARYHYTSNYCAPVVRQPVCQPVCQPVACTTYCDPCRRSGLLGLGFLGIL